MSEAYVFGCEDLRREILEFVYPRKVLVGMTVKSHSRCYTSGQIIKIKKINNTWHVNVKYTGIYRTNKRYVIIDYFRGTNINLKVLCSNI